MDDLRAVSPSPIRPSNLFPPRKSILPLLQVSASGDNTVAQVSHVLQPEEEKYDQNAQSDPLKLEALNRSLKFKVAQSDPVLTLASHQQLAFGGDDMAVDTVQPQTDGYGEPLIGSPVRQVMKQVHAPPNPFLSGFTQYKKVPSTPHRSFAQAVSGSKQVGSNLKRLTLGPSGQLETPSHGENMMKAEARTQQNRKVSRATNSKIRGNRERQMKAVAKACASPGQNDGGSGL